MSVRTKLSVQHLNVHAKEEIQAIPHFHIRKFNWQVCFDDGGSAVQLDESWRALSPWSLVWSSLINIWIIMSLKLIVSLLSTCLIDVMAFFCFLFRLCVAALSVNSFCGSREALYGVFDGDRNVEVPYLLQCTMNDVLAEELHKTKSEEDYMTNTFLVMQRYMNCAFNSRRLFLQIIHNMLHIFCL